MIVLSLVLLMIITQFDAPMYQDAPVGAGFFPAVVASIQILICCVLIIQYKNKKNKANQEEPLVSSKSIFGITFLIGYAVLISLVGYLVASLVGFTYYLIVNKIKKPFYYLFAWIFVFVIYFLFGEVFVISLPEGLLFY
jgi:ABC-type xylose transport system permease subunit